MTELKHIHQNMQNLLKTKDFIIAGGCIASYVQGENINDIDCFFINEEAYKCALNSITKNKKMHVENIKTRKNSNAFELKDYDHKDFPFFKGLVVDLIFIPELEVLNEVINSFDLKHCCAFYDSENDMIITKDSTTLYFIKGKILSFNNFKNPFGELARVSKFIKRGYSITDIDRKLLLQNLLSVDHNALQLVYEQSRRITKRFAEEEEVEYEC